MGTEDPGRLQHHQEGSHPHPRRVHGDGRSGSTTASPRGLTPPPPACTWGDQLLGAAAGVQGGGETDPGTGTIMLEMTTTAEEVQAPTGAGEVQAPMDGGTIAVGAGATLLGDTVLGDTDNHRNDEMIVGLITCTVECVQDEQNSSEINRRGIFK